jgi:hypothetical protein
MDGCEGKGLGWLGGLGTEEHVSRAMRVLHSSER